MAAGDVVPASDIDVRIGTSKLTANTTAFSAETTVLTVTVTLVAGLTYKIQAYARPFASATASPSAEINLMRIREDTITGAQLQVGQVYLATGTTVGFQITLYTEYVAVATGSKTFVLTSQRNGGANTHVVTGSTNSPGMLFVDYMPQ